ncbi:hypothetical protein GCM10018952_36890 [Streptosporangium vulgare]
MSTLTGVGVSPGVGVGPAHVLAYEATVPAPGSRHGGEAGDAAAELALAGRALERVAADLEERGARAGGEAREILEAQAMMARDPGLADGVATLVEAGTAAARAVYEAFGHYRDLLAAAGGYLGERVADLDDVRDRAIAVIEGRPAPGPPEDTGQPYVLVARDLAPADTALLSPDVVAAFVTEQGGPTSHTPRSSPAPWGCRPWWPARGRPRSRRGRRCWSTGHPVSYGPRPPTTRSSGRATPPPRGRPCWPPPRGRGRPPTGTPCRCSPTSAGLGMWPPPWSTGPRGSGSTGPSSSSSTGPRRPPAAEQEAAYLEVLDAFPGGRVIVRTLDAGADKPLAFLPPGAHEPNPALGERGVRLFRTHPEIMDTQLAALAAAAARSAGRLQVMAPMVATAEEAAWFADACDAAGLPSAGVMVEIPSAALRASDLAVRAGFLSIGTNDLAQYALAADRQLGALTGLQDAWQPALLDLVALAAAGAAERGRQCGACGEAAADPALACVLVGLGVTSLSMSAPALPAVRAALSRHTRQQCHLAAAAARARGLPGGRTRRGARAHLPGLAGLAL